jgi:hypothetical protein
MPSRLSSLLVRDGLVGVKRMEKAFQRQVIYGGSLDTILLEMNLLPEDRLTQYLALASGLPPASKEEAAHIRGDALALIGSDIASQFRALPLTLDGEALRVLVCSPLEITELEDLADLLDRPLQPLITPEYRWHLAYARAYALEAPARFLTLARTIASDGTVVAPIGRARNVIVDDASARVAASGEPDATAPLVAPPRPPTFGVRNDPTERIEFKLPEDVRPPAPSTTPAPTTAAPVTATTAIPRPAKPAGAVPLVTRDDATEKIVYEPPLHPQGDHSRTKTLMGIKPMPAATTDSVGVGIPPRAPAPPSMRPQSSPAIGVPATGGATASSTQSSSASGMIVPPPLPTTGARPGIGRAAIEPLATSGRDSPLAVVRARELLATAEDRDTVFLTLLRATRARARYAGLLTVQGGAAIGRIALAETGIDTATIHSVLIPLDAMSPFRSVTKSLKPHIGPLVAGDAGIDSMVMRMGGAMPPSALLMPVVLRDRAVAIVFAHRGHADLKLVDVAELLPLASGAADALGRLIVRHKSAGYRAPEAGATPNVEIADDKIDTKKIVRKDAEWSAPAARQSVPVMPVAAVEDAKPAAPPRPITELLDAIEGAAGEGEAAAEIAEAVERAQEALGELAQRFPGKLRVDRFAVSGRPLRAAQYGGLLELIVRLGAAAGELIIDRMNASQRDVRFYATVCAAELRPRNAVFALVERLFDEDYGVRSTAIEALAGYPTPDLAHAFPRARRALHSSDPETVAAATAAVVQLGDIEAVDELIGILDRGDRGAEHARKALITLTAQDFGLSEKKWRKWYETAHRRHRIEWLIEGLVHKEEAIRETAINDLRRVTGEYFGYHHDLPRKERDAAAERWQSWWRETGRRRFVERDDERNRPTGLLPARRDPPTSS